MLLAEYQRLLLDHPRSYSRRSCSKRFPVTSQSRISPTTLLTCVAAPAATQHSYITRAYMSLPGNPRKIKQSHRSFEDSSLRDDQIDFLWIPGDQSKTMPRYLYSEDRNGCGLAFDLCLRGDATVSTIASSLRSESVAGASSPKIFV